MTDVRPANRPRGKNNGSPFARWADACGLSIATIAAKLGVQKAMVYRYRDGNAKPGRERAAKIAELTDGFVSVASWDAKPSRKVKP